MSNHPIPTDPGALSPGEQTLADALAVHPRTGELVPADAPANQLADVVAAIGGQIDALRAMRHDVLDELARRLDMLGRRSATLDGVALETNAPTEDTYDVNLLRAELALLVTRGTISPRLVDELIVYPSPKPPEPRVDKRRVNALLRSDDRELLGALSRSRTRVAQRRTIKVLGVVTDTTAEPEP